MKPRKQTLEYLTGWFLLDTKGNHKLAKRKAELWLQQNKSKTTSNLGD